MVVEMITRFKGTQCSMSSFKIHSRKLSTKIADNADLTSVHTEIYALHDVNHTNQNKKFKSIQKQW